MICRGCHQETGDEVLVDLGMQPLANSLVLYATDVLGTDQDGFRLEHRYPLAPVICKNKMCRLIQLPELPSGITPFTEDYPYRSGQSATWKLHLQDLVDEVHPTGVTVEIGGNDGSLGELLPGYYCNIDPTQPASAWENGATISEFMTRPRGEVLGPCADWVVALNVMAHVPDLDDFFAGIYAVLKPTGILTVEVQDVNQLIERGEWDCIYHEHYSYFNKQTLADAIERRGFYVEKYEDIPTHGGSIRLTARKIEQRLLDHPLHRQPLRPPKPYPKWPPTDGLSTQAGMCLQWADEGRRVVGYGAPAKAMTWLNSFRRPVPLEYICDSTPEKIGKFTPASHIEIKSPDVLDTDTPDIIVVLAWNWLSEIRPKLQAHVDRGVEIWCRGERVA